MDSQLAQLFYLNKVALPQSTRDHCLKVIRCKGQPKESIMLKHYPSGSVFSHVNSQQRECYQVSSFKFI
ncbi:hypothetical protein LXL04_033893 [Taraxacum kok-saghyz]